MANSSALSRNFFEALFNSITESQLEDGPVTEVVFFHLRGTLPDHAIVSYMISSPDIYYAVKNKLFRRDLQCVETVVFRIVAILENNITFYLKKTLIRMKF